MNLQSTLACACLLTVMGTAAQADDLIVNGSFESPGYSGNAILPSGSEFVAGWTTVLNGAEYFNATAFGGAADGSMVVDLAHYIYSAGGIEQTVTTTIGETYDVSFYLGNFLASGRDGTGIVKVTVGGVTQSFDTPEATAAVMVWDLASFQFTAVDTTTTIRFWNDQNANQHFALIDGVGVTAAVPEPGTWALLLTGLGLLGWAARRR